jgi:asparagine synthase (glutamine-hydrolysing)
VVRELGAVALDRDTLGAMILADTHRDTVATAYRDIRRVRPCETVHFRDGTTRSSFAVPGAPALREGKADALAEELLHALAAAVDRAVGGAARVAVLAGGGVDSSALLATLLRQAESGRSSRAVGIAWDFDGPGADRPHMAAVEQYLGAEVLRVRPADASDLFESSFVLDAAPYTWPTGPFELRAAERARAWGAKAVLSGAGGDHILDGDCARFAERVAHGDLRALVDAARLVQSFRSTPLERVKDLVLRPLAHRAVPASALRRRWDQQHRRAVRRSSAWGWGGPHLRRLLGRDLPAKSRDGLFSAWARSGEFGHAADDRGHSESRYGCDRTDPYLDPDFVRFVASLPPDLMFHGARTRGLLRHAMRGLLPESMRLRRDKASFEPAVDELVAGMDRTALDSLLTMEATADLGLVNPAAFRAAFEAQRRGQASRCGWLDVWPALAVEAFVREVSGGTHGAARLEGGGS